MADVTVYGKLDCADTQRSRALLDAEGVGYRFIDVLADDEAREHARTLSGGLSVPVVVVPSGRVLVEPSDEEMLEALTEQAA